MSKKIIVGAVATIFVVGVAGIAIAKHKHMRGHHGMHSMNMLKKADANKDGTITKDELRASQQNRFKAIDTNNDGVIGVEEVQQRMARRMEKRAKRMTRRFDANRDGKVTEEEFLAAADKRLYVMDLNDDGQITKDEMRGHRGGKRGHWRHRHHGSHRRGSYDDDESGAEKKNAE